jgi:AcrR family transcriptional regulator
MDPQSDNRVDGSGGAPAVRSDVPSDDRKRVPALARVLERRPADVEIRKLPIQARGAATFDAILDATAQLLEQAGHEILTTNLVAEVAGVNIATLYQYFPSKEAILLALFRRDTDSRIAAGQVPLDQADGSTHWRDVVSEAIDALVHMRRGQVGATALRRAMRSLPELQAYERETMISSARTVAAKLLSRPGLSAERAELMGLCVMETVTALLDLWSLGDTGTERHDDRIIGELKRMVFAYLAPELD